MAMFMTSSILFIIFLCFFTVHASVRHVTPNRGPLYNSINNDIPRYKNVYERWLSHPSKRTISNVLWSGYSGSRTRGVKREETVTVTIPGSEELNQQENGEYKFVDDIQKGDHTYDDMTLSEEACYRGSVISCNKGTVTSLGYPESYSANISCRWLIKAPKGQVVHLNFRDLSLGEGDCVTLSYRGSAVQKLYDPAVKLCGELRPRKFTSVGHEVEVRFRADDTEEGRGMLFHYNIRQPVPCEDLIELEGISGTISSPGYPRYYEAHSNCTWRIIAPQNKRVSIMFNDLAIEYARSCDYDVLTLYDGATTSDTKLATYCGHRLPDDVTASTNVILLVLTSDISSEDRGFSLQWSAT